MERVVLRHLTGSKSHQIEEIPLDRACEIVFGRDPVATVRYDQARDDLVSRLHARLAQDPGDPHRFTLIDLNSRNGTYVNRQRVSSPVAIRPGDVIQLGAGGPELQFDMYPVPTWLLRTTDTAEAPVDGFGWRAHVWKAFDRFRLRG